MAFTVSTGGPRRRSACCAVPWLPIVLGVVSIVCTGVWHHFSTLALRDTRVIAALIGMPPPKAFAAVLPALMAASLAAVICAVLLVWAVYAWRGAQRAAAGAPGARTGGRAGSGLLSQLRPLVVAAGVVNFVLYAVLVWFVVMFGISLLWLGGGMVASKATMDGANTLTVVDETLPKLIKTAMGIDPAKQGYLVHVAGRDVNIGSSSCSLFCFTLARAMLADTIDCTCDQQLAASLMPAGNVTADITEPAVCGSTPVMCSINAYAFSLYHAHMRPALVAIVVAVLSLIGLLMLLSGTFARALAEHQRGSLSRCSSADVDMRVGEDGSPRKGAPPV